MSTTILADRVGFEPTVELSSYDGLANHSPNDPCVIGAHGETRTPNICVLSAATLPIGLHGQTTEVYQGDETRTGTLGHKLLVRNERLELPTVGV